MKIVTRKLFEALEGKVLYTLTDYDKHAEMFVDRPGIFIRDGSAWDRGVLPKGMHVTDLFETEPSHTRYADNGALEIDMDNPIDICTIKSDTSDADFYRIFTKDDIKNIVIELNSLIEE